MATPTKRRNRSNEPDLAHTERMVAGVVCGGVLGLPFGLLLTQFIAAPADGSPPEAVALWTLRVMAGCVIGGALGGGLIGRMLPVLRDPLVGLPTGILGAFLFVGTIRISCCGVDDFTSVTAIALAATAVVLGTMIALFGREVLRHGEPRNEEVPRSWNAVLWRVIEVAAPRRRRATSRRQKRRERIRSQPFPDEWRQYIDRNVPYAVRLSRTDREELERQINVFVAEKQFEGCGGLEINDEVRVTIAAQACLLTLRLDADYYPKLRTILVYPSTFVPKRPSLRPAWSQDRATATLGESWAWGIVILSWDSVLAGAANVHDGHNVVLHEFAHQLDQEDGYADGVPYLPRTLSYVTWAHVLRDHFADHVRATNRGKPHVLDAYGATNPAEFFAVATETFFEKPRQLFDSSPALYEELRRYYGQDPVAYADRVDA